MISNSGLNYQNLLTNFSRYAVRLMRFQEIVDGIVVKVTIDEILSNDVISGVIQVLEQNARASISSKRDVLF